MPRNGSGVYSKPAGTTAVANTVIESAKYNQTIDDIVADLNASRPVVAGGTGGNTAATARANLGAAAAVNPLAAVASAATTDIGSAPSENVYVTGTNTITSLGTAPDGTPRTLLFEQALTLTHDISTLILPGFASIRTAGGDTAIFNSQGGGKWRCISYQRANGLSIDAPFAVSTSSNLTLTLAERGNIISVDASGGSRTITLPPAAIAGNGFSIIIKKSDSSSNSVVIDGNAAETIDGATIKVLRFQNESIILICGGSGWLVAAENSIIDSGNNANGEYVRFANGYMVCTKRMAPGVATATVSGNIFISPAINAGSLPVTFSSVPTVTVTGSCGAGNGWTLATAAPTTSTWGTYRHASAVSDATTTGWLHLEATGFWL